MGGWVAAGQGRQLKEHGRHSGAGRGVAALWAPLAATGDCLDPCRHLSTHLWTSNVTCDTPFDSHHLPPACPAALCLLCRARNIRNTTAVDLSAVSLQYWFDAPVEGSPLFADYSPDQFFTVQCEWATTGGWRAGVGGGGGGCMGQPRGTQHSQRVLRGNWARLGWAAALHARARSMPAHVACADPCVHPPAHPHRPHSAPAPAAPLPHLCRLQAATAWRWRCCQASRAPPEPPLLSTSRSIPRRGCCCPTERTRCPRCSLESE